MAKSIKKEQQITDISNLPNTVIFIVKYDSSYNGEKNMPEGEVVVSKEVAVHFESIGIGQIKL